MFYSDLVRIDPALHLGYGVRPVADFSTAKTANAVPLGISEFWQASAYYPIVFGPKGGSAFPVAVTALIQGRNLLVDEQGQWLADTYQPAWIRRYPFWMQPDEDGANASFWFDPAAGRVVPLQEFADASPLFDYKGDPNQALLDIVSFSQQCMGDAQQTMAFMKALEEHQLLVERAATIELTPGAAPYKLSGFRAIDMDRYAKLPDNVLAQWARNGWAALVSLHVISMQHNWKRLLVLHHMVHG